MRTGFTYVQTRVNVRRSRGYFALDHSIVTFTPDWTGEKLSFRKLVRLLPDPYRHTGRLRITYEADGRRLNLDGESLHPGWSFQLFADGAYRTGRLEVGPNDRFYFIFSEQSRPDIILLPGMQARL
jgi:hypothetical protein